MVKMGWRTCKEVKHLNGHWGILDSPSESAGETSSQFSITFLELRELALYNIKVHLKGIMTRQTERSQSSCQ